MFSFFGGPFFSFQALSLETLGLSACCFPALFLKKLLSFSLRLCFSFGARLFVGKALRLRSLLRFFFELQFFGRGFFRRRCRFVVRSFFLGFLRRAFEAHAGGVFRRPEFGVDRFGIRIPLKDVKEREKEEPVHSHRRNDAGWYIRQTGIGGRKARGISGLIVRLSLVRLQILRIFALILIAFAHFVRSTFSARPTRLISAFCRVFMTFTTCS